MAAGRLDVLLGLNAAEFTKGLSKAEYETRQFQQRMVRNAAAIGTAFKTIATGFVAVSVVKGFKDVIGALDDLDEAAQAVGASSAVSLANFRRAALDSGVSVEGLDKALTKLNVTMSKAASGDANAIAAFKTLGINVKDASGNLRASDEVLKDVADAFSRYRDGAEKSALAAALFGEKIGPKMVALLNQGRAGLEGYNQVSQETIDRAKELQSQFDKLEAGIQKVGYAVVGSLAPALNELLDRFNRAITATGDFDTAMNRLFLNRSAAELQEQIAGAEKKLKDLDDAYFFKDERQEKLREHIANMRKELKFLGDEAERISQINTDKFLRGSAAARAGEPGRGASGLPTAPTIPDSASGKKKKEAIDENAQAYARYVDQLAQGLDKEQQLSAVQEATRAIEQNRFGTLIPQQKELLLLLAAQKDAATEYGEKVAWLAEQERAATAAALEREDLIDTKTGRKEARQTEKELQIFGEEFKEGRINFVEYQIATHDYFNSAQKDINETNDAAKELGLIFASSIGDFIKNPTSGKTFFQALMEDLLQLTTQLLIIEPLAKSLKGAFSGMMGGGSGGGGNVWDELLKAAGDMVSYDVGTAFVPADGPAMLHRGERVLTAEENKRYRGGNSSVVINQSFAPGTSRETINQAAAAASRQLSNASRRNN
jgi:hypothetical protein